MKRAIFHVAAVVAILASFACRSVEATVIALTSGENTGGWAAPVAANVVAAYNINAYFNTPAGTGTIQGVTFQNGNLDTYGGAGSLPAGDSLTGVGGSYVFGQPATPTGYSGASVNDTNMADMLGSIYYGDSMTLTLANLVAGSQYNLAYFTYSSGSETETIASSSAGGGTSVSDNVGPFNNVAYVVEQKITVGTSGTIVTDIESGGPRFSGFVLSAIPVPEPSTFVLIGFGAVGLLASVRRVAGAAD